MSRFNVWLVCCVVIMLGLLVDGGSIKISMLIGMFAYTAAPLLLHWAFATPTKVSKDD